MVARRVTAAAARARRAARSGEAAAAAHSCGGRHRRATEAVYALLSPRVRTRRSDAVAARPRRRTQAATGTRPCAPAARSPRAGAPGRRPRVSPFCYLHALDTWQSGSSGAAVQKEVGRSGGGRGVGQLRTWRCTAHRRCAGLADERCLPVPVSGVAGLSRQSTCLTRQGAARLTFSSTTPPQRHFGLLSLEPQTAGG